MKTQLDKVQRYIIDILNTDCTTEWDHLNYLKIPIVVIPASQEKTYLFNDLYKLILANKSYQPLKRTKSGGISISCNNRYIFNKYDIRQLNNCLELTVCTLELSVRIQFRTNNFKTNDNEDFISATHFYNKEWLPRCKKLGIDMKSYYIGKETGLKEKELIHSADIKLYHNKAKLQLVCNGAKHLDFHKFYPSGLIDEFKEFEPIVKEINDLVIKYKSEGNIAKANYYKTGIDSLIGLWQSECFKYKLAHLSRRAINNSYTRFDKVKEQLLAENRILATNTDGIWYFGEEFINEDFGPGLKQYSTDHKDCRIRFKSAGSYEYIENNKYTPVVRGKTRLDNYLPREKWEWGDIFLETAKVLKWKFIKGVGIQWQEQE